MFGSGQLQFFTTSDDPFYSKAVGQSLRFNGSTTHLDKTMGDPTDNNRFTFSTWLKRSKLGTSQMIFSAATSLSSYIQFQPDDTIKIRGSNALEYETDMKFRDTGSWYHIVFAFNSDASEGDRARLYVNGTEINDFNPETHPGPGESITMNSAVKHSIGTYSVDDTFDFDGYLAEMYFVDGEQLSPTAFGETKNDIWIPKTPSISDFGNNGFHLSFADSSDIGNDTSGKGNDFTPAGFNATTDVVSDSPTNNFATLNPLTGGSSTASNGNLEATIAPVNGAMVSTFAVNSGKWYCEMTPTTIAGYFVVGIGAPYSKGWSSSQEANAKCIVYTSQGNLDAVGTWSTASSTVSGTYTTNDVIGIALDMQSATKTIEFYKNGTSVGSANITVDDDVSFLIGNSSGSSNGIGAVNFGQQPFDSSGPNSGEPPSGYKRLNTSNLPNPEIDPAEGETPDQYFDTALYTGNSSTQSITGLQFQPDFVWLKSRSLTISHGLFDVVRGTSTAGSLSTAIGTDRVDAEGNGNGVLSSFNSDGFTVDQGSSGTASLQHTITNKTGETYVAWTWKAGGSGVTNNNGSNSSTVSASDESGFSIVKYAGTGNTTTQTLGHGLTSAPDAIWIKELNGTSGWVGYFRSEGPAKTFALHNADAAGDSTAAFNNTDPTASVFSVGQSNGTNESGKNYIAYCFSNVDGYQKIGTYEGVDSTDNAFVFTGFRPRFIIIKNIDATGNWGIWDTARNPFNLADKILRADTSDNFNDASPNNDLDILSNGFKVRADTGLAGNANTYLYMAIAEQPFKYANAR